MVSPATSSFVVGEGDAEGIVEGVDGGLARVVVGDGRQCAAETRQQRHT